MTGLPGIRKSVPIRLRSSQLLRFFSAVLTLSVRMSTNAPEYQQKNGQQFISRVRTQAGVKWRVSRLSSLDFYYRFTYGYDRDINITKNKGNIELTEETLYQHSFGVSYHIDL